MNKDYSFQKESVKEVNIEHITLLLNFKHCFLQRESLLLQYFISLLLSGKVFKPMISSVNRCKIYLGNLKRLCFKTRFICMIYGKL